MVVQIANVDFAKPRVQRDIILRMIQDWSVASDTQRQIDAGEVDGLVHLIDAIQDYAVDTLNVDDVVVFGH